MTTFDEICEKLMEELNEDIVEVKPRIGQSLGKGTTFRQKFEINDINYEIDVTYYEDIDSSEIRFAHIDKESYGLTGDAGVKGAFRTFGAVIYMINQILNKLNDQDILPKHIFFSSDDEKRAKLYQRLYDHKLILQMMDKLGYVHDQKYAKVIKDFVDREEGNNKKYYKNLTVFCFTKI